MDSGQGKMFQGLCKQGTTTAAVESSTPARYSRCHPLPLSLPYVPFLPPRSALSALTFHPLSLSRSLSSYPSLSPLRPTRLEPRLGSGAEDPFPVRTDIEPNDQAAQGAKTEA
ncbi:hypothetical protein M407DRAFT_167031 [Tulasnella calospora MUT 4182]|uniref:Uncharacterized protein n=1 Tax=Tulasnella calospora MUT 4182 TaxID=1051891 RepID=A0A0C3M790_9AGAM|nr:hypothetical protein M407DRAFT_167031 [Tulasnella calospora MUT 4182]